MEDLLYALLGLLAQGLIPCTVGYFRQMLLLKNGKDSSGKVRLRWIILPALAVCILSVAGMNYCPSLESFWAGLYLLTFAAAFYSAAFALGKWFARSDFRRKQNS